MWRKRACQVADRRCMMLRNVVLGMIVVTLVAGCQPKAGGLVGTWRATRGANVIEFTDDGQINQDRPGHRVFTWYRIDGDQMTVGHVVSGAPDETVRFELSGDTLTIGSCLALGTMGATKFTRVQD